MFDMFFSFVIKCDALLQTWIQEYCSPQWLYAIIDFIARKEHVLFPLFILVPFLFYKNWKKTVCFLMFLLVVLVLSDQSSNLLKKNIVRYRPFYKTLTADEKIGINPNTSFPSSHAANISAATMIIWAFWPVLRVPTCIVAFLVCYGRLYLDKHYPLDVLTGCCIGVIYAYFLLFITRDLRRKFERIRH